MNIGARILIVFVSLVFLLGLDAYITRKINEFYDRERQL